MTERDPEIRVGLTEAAHMASNPYNFVKPLSVRVQEAKEMGYYYEAMPGWTTSLEAVFILGLGNDSAYKRQTIIQERVLNLHPAWTDDRNFSGPKNESITSGIVRSTQSHIMSALFIAVPALRRLALVTDATLVTHWPQTNDCSIGGTDGDRSMRQKLQDRLSTVEATLVAEDHANIGMNNIQLETWLGEDSPHGRGLAFVSGLDHRDQEYGRKSGINPLLHAKNTQGIYVKAGWDPESLAGDLRSVLNVQIQEGTNKIVWLMVNDPGGANEKTADQLQEIVEQAQKG